MNLKQQKVENNTELKEILLNYVGNNLTPGDKDVTVDMIVEVMAEEFPEFLWVVAEENYFRGYEQALVDLLRPNKKHADG